MGSYIGPPNIRKAFLQKKILEVEALATRIYQLPKQHAMLLLRLSTSNLVRHLPKTIEAQKVETELETLDNLILKTAQ